MKKWREDNYAKDKTQKEKDAATNSFVNDAMKNIKDPAKADIVNTATMQSLLAGVPKWDRKVDEDESLVNQQTVADVMKDIQKEKAQTQAEELGLNLKPSELDAIIKGAEQS